MFFFSLICIYTTAIFFFFNGFEEKSCTNMADRRIRASITVSIVFGKHVVIRVVPTSEGCCTSSMMSKSPFKPPSPTATSSRLHSGTKLEQLSSLFCTPVNDCYCFPLLYLETSHCGPHCKRLLSLSGFLSSLAEGRELAEFPAHHCNSAVSHLPPPLPSTATWTPTPASPPAVAVWLTKGTMPTIQLMYLIDSWNLLMLKPAAMVTAQYVHIHEWKYIFSRICKRNVETLCVAGLWDVQMFGGWLTVCWRWLLKACSRPDIHLEKLSFSGFGQMSWLI